MSSNHARTQVGASVVSVRSNLVFLGQRPGIVGGSTRGSAWGNLETGESLEDCASREALEEEAVAVEDLNYLGVSNIIAYGRHYGDGGFLRHQEPIFLLNGARSLLPGGVGITGTLQPSLFQVMWYVLDSFNTGRHYYD